MESAGRWREARPFGGRPLSPVPYGPPRKRSLTLARHRTSVSVEDPFWDAFQRIARAEGLSVNALATRIDRQRGLEVGLASAIRLYVLHHALEGRAQEDGTAFEP